LLFVTYKKLPQGVFLLNQLKTFSKIFATGQTKHSGKFTRITRIIESFPGRKFVLLGDDSQQDPAIYNSIVSHFPGTIYCVYIRRIGEPEKASVREKGKMIEAAGTLFYYFAHSTDAIAHSRKIGLIK
jgi:phosphatidate phosphatase APP1